MVTGDVDAPSLSVHHRADLQSENDFLLANNKILKEKILKLGKTLKIKQIKLDSTLAELEKSNNKNDQLMKTFGKKNYVYLKYFAYTGRPRIWHQVLPVFFYFFFNGSTWYKLQQKKI